VEGKLRTDKFSQDEKMILQQEGLELDNDPTNDLVNNIIAMIHGEEILKVWREREIVWRKV
jgi:hypothetical protein